MDVPKLKVTTAPKKVILDHKKKNTMGEYIPLHPPYKLTSYTKLMDSLQNGLFPKKSDFSVDMISKTKKLQILY